MKGYQISFFAEQGQRIEGKMTTEWLMHLAKSLGITGTTTLAGIRRSSLSSRTNPWRF